MVGRVRVALVHDWLTGMRGGERVLHELALLYPQARLYTLVHVPGSTSPAIERLDIHSSPLSRLPGAANHYRKLLPLFPWAVKGLKVDDCDLVISCSHAVAKSVRPPPHTPHLSYCLTPMRYIWSQADRYLGRGLRRALATPLVAGLRRFDRRTSGPERVTRFVAISSEVSRRIRSCYGRESEVVFPPVQVQRIRPNHKAPEEFYLMVGGFVPYKCEGMAIAAFQKLGRRLVVVGDGPDRRRLEAAAGPGIEFTGRISDAELADLYARCRALVYPQEEDFGIAAVEAQAAGRPVIAYGAGGARDTVVPLMDAELTGEHRAPTGLWFHTQSTAALCQAVRDFEDCEHRFDAGEIRRWAEAFGPERFCKQFQEQVDLMLRGAKGP